MFPSDHACISMGVATTRLIALETVDNFNPDFFNKTLAKNVNITVEPTLPGKFTALNLIDCVYYRLMINSL